MFLAVKYARTVLSCSETRHQTDGSCTSMARSHARARGLEQCPFHPPRTSSTTPYNFASSKAKGLQQHHGIRRPNCRPQGCCGVRGEASHHQGDSQLLVNFSNKEYTPKDEHMEAYLEEVHKMEKLVLGLELQHVPRGTNKEVYDIAKRAS